MTKFPSSDPAMQICGLCGDYRYRHYVDENTRLRCGSGAVCTLPTRAQLSEEQRRRAS